MQDQKRSCADLLVLQCEESPGQQDNWHQTRPVNFHPDSFDVSQALPAWSRTCIIVGRSAQFKCSQCQTAFTEMFSMPDFWWSHYFQRSNGNFGCEKTRDSGVLTGINTWCKFIIKQIDRENNHEWHYFNIFTRWIPSTNQTVILAFDMDQAVKEPFLETVMARNPGWLKDPFWVYPYLLEQVSRVQEPSVWGIRYHARAIETEKTPEGRLQPNYRRLHDVLRHAIHVNETLDVAFKNIEEILLHHEEHIRTEIDDAPYHEEIHLRLRAFQSFLVSLRSRSISNEKRLQNEVQLAFNTVAQHDAHVNLEIGRAAQLDSATMKTIAFVTLTFLPPTFICAIFSMSFFNFGDDDSSWSVSSQFWIYWAFAIPITLLTTVVWTYWPQMRGWLLSKAKAKF